MIGELTDSQARCLRDKVCFGDFRTHHWPSIQALFDKGMIVEHDKRIMATSKGKLFMDEHHLEIA